MVKENVMGFAFNKFEQYRSVLKGIFLRWRKILLVLGNGYAISDLYVAFQIATFIEPVMGARGVILLRQPILTRSVLSWDKLRKAYITVINVHLISCCVTELLFFILNYWFDFIE